MIGLQSTAINRVYRKPNKALVEARCGSSSRIFGFLYRYRWLGAGLWPPRPKQEKFRGLVRKNAGHLGNLHRFRGAAVSRPVLDTFRHDYPDAEIIAVEKVFNGRKHRRPLFWSIRFKREGKLWESSLDTSDRILMTYQTSENRDEATTSTTN